MKYLQENIDLAALKKFLSKDDQSKSPNSKYITSQITIFKQLKKKIMYNISLDPNISFLCCAVFLASTVHRFLFLQILSKSFQVLIEIVVLQK